MPSLKKIVSFGYKHPPIPVEDTHSIVVDVRGFRNPYYVDRLASLPGTDPQILAFLKEDRTFPGRVDSIREKAMLPGLVTLYIGCTGGRHRSVAIAELLGREFGVEVVHREAVSQSASKPAGVAK